MLNSLELILIGKRQERVIRWYRSHIADAATDTDTDADDNDADSDGSRDGGDGDGELSSSIS